MLITIPKAQSEVVILLFFFFLFYYHNFFKFKKMQAAKV